MNTPTFQMSTPCSWTPLMSGVDATMNERTLSSLDENVFRLFDACVGVMTWPSLAQVGGNGKTFIHMCRHPVILNVCLEVIWKRNMPFSTLINFPTEVGSHSAYDLYWHNKDMKDMLRWWGGKVVNPMPKNTGITGRGRGLNLSRHDARNRRFRGYDQDGGEAEEEYLDV